MLDIWTGYDSKNSVLNSGKYQFKRVDKNIKILNLENKYVTKLCQISEEELGKNFIENTEVTRIILEKDNYISKVAVINNDVVGFVICKILDSDEVEEYLKIKFEDLPKAIRVSKKIAVIKSIAVNEENKGTGIAYKLIRESIEEIKMHNIQTICSLAWKSTNGTNLEGLLVTNKFKKGHEISNYWKEESEINGFYCPVCGNPPCRCSAELYFKSVISD